MKLHERVTAQERLLNLALCELRDIIAYLSSAKFQWPEGDYVHVRTDMLPRLMTVAAILTTPTEEA